MHPLGGSRREALQRWALVALGMAGLVLTVMALGVCADVLVWHRVPWLLQFVALVVASAALSSLLITGRRLVVLVRASRRLARELPVRPGPTVAGVQLEILPGLAPQAFCLGLLAPRIVLSEGALTELEGPRLAAVVAHEQHHARRRHGLRRVLAVAVAEGFVLVPAARSALSRYEVLLELEADRAALAESTRGELAGALLAFDDAGRGVEPERIDGLLVPGCVPPPVPGAMAQGSAFCAVLVGLVGLMTAWSGCTEIFLLGQSETDYNRYEALLVVLATATVFLVARGAVLRHVAAAAR